MIQELCLVCLKLYTIIQSYLSRRFVCEIKIFTEYVHAKQLQIPADAVSRSHIQCIQIILLNILSLF